jgi:hypothetical protein
MSIRAISNLPGSWAVVPGASDDIGHEFAEQLAAKGHRCQPMKPPNSTLYTYKFPSK